MRNMAKARLLFQIPSAIPVSLLLAIISKEFVFLSFLFDCWNTLLYFLAI